MSGYLIQSPVEQYATTTPDHPAFIFQGKSLSYRELNEKSNQLASALISRGAKPQDRVAIYTHKCLEIGIAIYGVLKAGCVFVPIDPLINKDRLSLIIKDCGIKRAICSDELVASLQSATPELSIQFYGGGNSATTNHTYSWQSIFQQEPVSMPAVPLTDQDLGYIMYTSGSTGIPKGMLHSHLGSITYARWGAQHVSLIPSDRVASYAPLHFDLSIFDFFSTAQAGATVVLVPEAVTRFPASWTQTIEDERISVVFTVPYTLISMQTQGALDKRDVSSLRWILYGGEPFPPGKLREVMLALPDVRFTNVYGPAEAPSCICYDVPLPEAQSREPIPIGTVSQNSAEIIVDEHDKDCPTAHPGELCIRSSSLMQGYWNRPELNEAAYLYRQGHGHFPLIYYRTGDIVMRDANGLLHFLGRRDRLVKVRGQRVELDEVESAMAAHPAVFEAAALALQDQDEAKQIVCAVTLKPHHTVDEDALFRHARDRLSAVAIPREIAIKTALPHNSSGKIDRKTLALEWLSSQN